MITYNIYIKYGKLYATCLLLVRATILLAGNILEPYGSDQMSTKLTQIAHVNPGGGADTPAIAWVGIRVVSEDRNKVLVTAITCIFSCLFDR